MENEIYREHILNHYRNPRNKYALEEADVVGKESNRLCGDEVTVYARMVEGGVISAMSFTGDGCAISQAAASLLTEYANGKTADNIQRMALPDMEQLLGVTLSAVRAYCAVLPLRAFHNGLQKNETKN